jgi:23S rRNA (uracil1939-C5)-methyltransferase
MKVVFNDAFIAQHVILMWLSQIHLEMECTKMYWTNHENCCKVVYVSCNSATQARDLALMDEK